jgi:hypothetical protein
MAAKKPSTLRRTMTVDEFDRGYWYALEVKAFARDLGIHGAVKLRKDQLETAIRRYLRTGVVPVLHTGKIDGKPDFEKGLHVRRQIVRYVDNRKTKEFLKKEARRIDPGLKWKSGSMYRLNRWREDQIRKRKKITYGDLVCKFVELNRAQGPFPRIAVGRYINFIADFMAGEKNPTRAAAIRTWHRLKVLQIPKDYASWVKYRKRKIFANR